MKTLQPWQAKVSTIALIANEKLVQGRKMQTIVISMLEEEPTVNLVNATRESVDEITQEIAKLRANFNKLNNEIWDTVHPPKADASDSGTSHK